ncbi:hypothetical protein DFJ74DRAFT_194987 [Hyaloraphidium curvatum]|nr:hypothetical protein DFJ74DRAFT_194987 [Hyaloraphidium curvatum]
MEPPRYTLYGYDISYFTGKLECYLRYRGIAYEFVQPTRKVLVDEILPNTGKMKVPVLYDRLADKWLQDSTSIIVYLEGQLGVSLPVVPEDPVHAFFSFLLEDYADESLWRPALYYRWAFEPDRSLNAARFRKEFLQDLRIPDFLVHRVVITRQLSEYVTGDGIRDAAAKELTELMYTDTLDALEAHFQVHPFLLGTHPTLADFGFAGPMFRHFSIDPTPAGIMRRRAPAVYAWVARLWNSRPSSTGTPFVPCAPPGEIPDTWLPLLRRVGEWYLPYLRADALAFREGRASFDWGPYRGLPAVQFRVWCREKLQSRLAAVPDAARGRVRGILADTGCLDPLLADGTIPSGLEDADMFPFYRPREPVARTWRSWVMGFEPPPRGREGRRMPWNEEVLPLRAERTGGEKNENVKAKL